MGAAAFQGAMAVIGIGTSIYGGIKANKAAKAAARRQKLIGRLNSADAESRGRDALALGERAVRNSNLRNLAMMGEARAGLGASNRSLTFGSGADAVKVIEYYRKLDAKTIRQNAGRAQEGFKHEAKMHQLGASAAASASRAQGIGELLSGIGGAARAAGQLASSMSGK